MNHYYGIRTTPRQLIDANLADNSAALVEVLNCNDIIYLDRSHGYEDFNFSSFKAQMKVEYKFWAKGIMRSYIRESKIKNKNPYDVLLMFKEYLNIPVLIDDKKVLLDDDIIFSPIIIKRIELYSYDRVRGSMEISPDMEEIDVKAMKEIRARFNIHKADLIHVVTVRHVD